MQKPGFGDNPKAKDLSSGSGAKLRIAAAVLLFVGLPFAPSMPEWKAFCFLTGTCRTVRAVCSGWFPDPLCRSLAPNILLQSCRRFFSSVCFFFPALLGVAAFLLFCFPEPYRRIPDMADFFPFFCSGRSILPAIACRRMHATPFSVSSIYKTYSCSLHGINPNLAESLLSFRYNKEKPVRGI